MDRDFRRLSGILGINRRNLDVISVHNPRAAYPLVDNKLKTKEVLEQAGVPFPKTIRAVAGFLEIDQALRDLRNYRSFVVKPASGRAGGGVLLVETATDGSWVRPSGRTVSPDDMRRHFGDILFGVYSFGRTDDLALVEQRVQPHEFLAAIYDRGIADIRVITFRAEPIMAMLRIPTDRSDGRANLHQGAVGVGVELESGRTGRAVMAGSAAETHPDSGHPLAGLQVPFWETIIDFSVRASRAVPLGYVGVDLVIDRDRGPLILELNARPGLQIQVINGAGLVDRIWRPPEVNT